MWVVIFRLGGLSRVPALTTMISGVASRWL
jgi:hypothetical protein